jgi:hypothetical protein
MGSSLLCCSALLFFLLFHFRTHPVAFSLVSLFLLRTMLDARVEKFVVWDDRLVVVSRQLFVTRRRVVLFSAVESVGVDAKNR